jgi:hypothetical protein
MQELAQVPLPSHTERPHNATAPGRRHDKLGRLDATLETVDGPPLNFGLLDPGAVSNWPSCPGHLSLADLQVVDIGCRIRPVIVRGLKLVQTDVGEFGSLQEVVTIGEHIEHEVPPCAARLLLGGQGPDSDQLVVPGVVLRDSPFSYLHRIQVVQTQIGRRPGGELRLGSDNLLQSGMECGVLLGPKGGKAFLELPSGSLGLYQETYAEAVSEALEPPGGGLIRVRSGLGRKKRGETARGRDCFEHYTLADGSLQKKGAAAQLPFVLLLTAARRSA